MIARWLPLSFIRFNKQALVALSRIDSKRMVGFQPFWPSIFTSPAASFLHLCPQCWKLSFTHLSLLLHLSHYYQQKIKSSKFNLRFPRPLRLSSTPASRSSFSHLFTPFFSTFLIQHKCCPDVRQQSLKEDIQNDKAIKGEERVIQKRLRETQRVHLLLSFLEPCQNSPSIFSPSYQNNRHSGRLMKLMKVKEWAFHMHQDYISCSYLIHVVFI